MAQISATKESKVEAALRGLNVSKEQIRALPQIAREIVLVAGLGKVNNLPRAKLCTAVKAKKELKELSKKAQGLFLHIQSMHKTSLDSFNKKGIVHPIALLGDLEMIISKTESTDINALVTKNSNLGRPGALDLEILMKMLAKTYTRLTGKKATKSMSENKVTGPYLRFVQDIFKALNIKNSASSQVLEQSKNQYKKFKKID